MEEDFKGLRNAIIRLLVEPSADLETIDSLKALKEWLEENVSWLIDNDFERLLAVLYRIDVSELKIKKLIAENEGENAAEIISNLMIEREIQKIESRKKYSAPKGDLYFEDDAETWN